MHKLQSLYNNMGKIEIYCVPGNDSEKGKF